MGRDGLPDSSTLPQIITLSTCGGEFSTTDKLIKFLYVTGTLHKV
jgi:hypothetical protein